MKTNILFIFIALLFAANVFAQSNDDFVIVNGELTEYHGPGGDVVIPDGVTAIAYNRSTMKGAFEGRSDITSITIPNSVINIRWSAFYGCTGLTSINIPNSVRYIESGAFCGCTGLTSINIPNSVIGIDNAAFYGCSGLTSISIGDSLSYFENLSYSMPTWSSLTSFTVSENNTTFCSLDGVLYSKDTTYLFCYPQAKPEISFDIPASVEIIPNGVFRNCNNLEAITVEDGSPFYSSLNGVLYNKNQTTLIWYPQMKPGISFTVPASVTTIGEDAFDGSRYLQTVDISDGVTAIGAGAFYNCTKLNDVTIPTSVETIGSSAFYGCSGLSSITIPTSVATINSSTFYGCSGLLSITIPTSITTIGSSAFYGCSGLPSITIPTSVETIESSAFYGCSGLSSITIPTSVETIGSSAFYGCSGLSSITIPSALTVIDESVFENCNSLTSIEIPANVQTIGNRAFAGCNLSSITFPLSVTEIGSGVFSGNNLQKITVMWDNPLPMPNGFLSPSQYTSCKLAVPAGTADLYRAAPVWKNFNTIEEFTGIPSIEKAGNIRVFPNPAKSVVYIQNGDGGKPEIKLFTLSGRLLLTMRGNEIDLSPYPAGSYLIRVNGETFKVEKL